MPQPIPESQKIIKKLKVPYRIKGTAIKKEKRSQRYHVGKKPRDTIKIGGTERYAVRRSDGTFADIQDPKLARSRDRQKRNIHKYESGADRRPPQRFYEDEKTRGLTDTKILSNLQHELTDIESSDIDPREKKSWIRRILERIGFVKSQQKIKKGAHTTQKGIATPAISVPEKMSPKDFSKRLDEQGLTKIQKIRAIEESQKVGRDILKSGKGATIDPVTGKIGKVQDLTKFERKQIRLDNVNYP